MRDKQVLCFNNNIIYGEDLVPLKLNLSYRSRAIVLLLQNYCLLSPPFFGGVCVWCCYVIQYCASSSFAVIWIERGDGCCTLIVFLVSCYCNCSVALPQVYISSMEKRLVQ